jgi:hypothetical protein
MKYEATAMDYGPSTIDKIKVKILSVALYPILSPLNQFYLTEAAMIDPAAKTCLKLL